MVLEYGSLGRRFVCSVKRFSGSVMLDVEEAVVEERGCRYGRGLGNEVGLADDVHGYQGLI